jgi:acyl-CoA thioesterase FadM
MSGILKNIITILFALFDCKLYNPQSVTTACFWVMPWDAGWRVLKSDKYSQNTEAAVTDYFIKTKLFSKLALQGISFVSVSQLIKFSKPISMFSFLQVNTRVLYLDTKFTYFEHVFVSQNNPCATVLVKMKFKQNRLTVNPTDLLGAIAGTKPTYLQLWDDSLGGIA